MNESLQSGTLLDPGHLTPDQFSAFIESALPEPDRLHAVAHLAACDQCRQIVLLVQAADDNDPDSLPASTQQPKPAAWRRWFVLNPILGAASAAFASVLLTSTAFVTQHHLAKPKPTQLAQTQPPAPLTPPKPQPAPEPVPTTPPPAPTQPPAPIVRQAAPPPTARQVADAAAALHLDTEPDSLSIPDGNDPDPYPSNSHSGKWKPHPLPSSLPAVAVVDKVHSKLAADFRGDLFLSLDGGGHWKQVRQQWHGRVIHLGITSGAPALIDPYASPDPFGEPPIPNENKSRFELTTDTNEHWISQDGLHWTPSPF